VETIERAGGRTEVLVTEGLTTVSYALDEAMVTFDTALKERVSNCLANAVAHIAPPQPRPHIHLGWHCPLLQAAACSRACS
jgi:hypothetical protein